MEAHAGRDASRVVERGDGRRNRGGRERRGLRDLRRLRTPVLMCSPAMKTALVVALMLAPAVAHAEPTPLEDVEHTLDRDRSSSRLWYFGWGGFYVVATSANVAVAFAADDVGLRADARVGAVKSGLGLIATLPLPPPSLFYFSCSSMDEARNQTCLREQRERLDDTAKAERFATSWLAHAGAIAVNVGGTLWSWQKDDRLVSGIIAGVVGIAIGELQIFTHPTIARGAKLAWRVHAPAGVRRAA